MSSDRKKTPSSWDPHDDMILRHLKEQLKLGWKEIAANFPNRTTNACQFRWRRLMSGNLKSQHSSPDNTAPATPTSRPSSPSMADHSSNVNGGGNGGMSSIPVPQGPQMPQMTVGTNPTSPGIQHGDSFQGSGSYMTSSRPWSHEEDNLLLNRKDLRSDELALLLPQRTEAEIASRASSLHSSSQCMQAMGSPGSVSDLARDRSSSVASSTSMSSTNGSSMSSVSSVSSSSTTTLNSYFSSELKRPVLSKPRSPYFEGLKKLPTPIVQRRQSLPYYVPRSTSFSGNGNYQTMVMNTPVIDTSS